MGVPSNNSKFPGKVFEHRFSKSDDLLEMYFIGKNIFWGVR